MGCSKIELMRSDRQKVVALADTLSSKKAGIWLLFITFVGFALRIVNVSSFNIYPDSYFLLLTAKNFINKIPLSYLGSKGMFYDPSLNLSLRYTPIPLIVALNKIFDNLEFSAHVLSFVAGLLAIPLMYFFISRVFDSRRTGLFASFLLAVSFSHVVWSGYVMTETLAIFLILLSATFVALSLKRQTSDYADFRDISAGILAALAVLTRVEYSVLIFGLVFLYISRSDKFVEKVLSFLAGLVATLTAVGVSTGILAEVIGLAPGVLRIHGFLLILTLSFWVLVCLIHRQKLRFSKIRGALSKMAALMLCVFLVLIYLRVATGPPVGTSFLWSERLTAVHVFSQYEFLIVITGLMGIAFLLLDDKLSDLGFFALIYIIPTAFLYNRVNPASYRYSIHHLPALILGSSFIISKASLLVERKWNENLWQKLVACAITPFLIAAIIAQTVVTAKSMEGWQTNTSYEKVAASKTRRIVRALDIPADSILLTFLAEPYYFYTNLSSWRATNKYPYVYDDFPIDKPVLIVVDEGTRDQVPEFASFVTTYLSSYQVSAFWTDLPYYFKAYHKSEQNPVALYYLPAGTASKHLSVARNIELR